MNSNPVDDVSIENEKVQIEAQIRKVVLSITNKITRSFNDVLLDVNTKGDDNFEFINELLSNSDIVTKLLPLVIVQTTPLILSDAKVCLILLHIILLKYFYKWDGQNYHALVELQYLLRDFSPMTFVFRVSFPPIYLKIFSVE